MSSLTSLHSALIALSNRKAELDRKYVELCQLVRNVQTDLEFNERDQAARALNDAEALEKELFGVAGIIPQLRIQLGL